MSGRTITTEATAQCTQHPEVATIEATVFADSDVPTNARALARDRVETVRKSITTVSSDQLKTVEMRVDEVDDLFGPETEADYRAEETLIVQCRPDRAETIVTAIIDTGGTVQAVEFGLHQNTYHQLQDDAIEEALERAREQAERIAATEGLQVSRLLAVSTKAATPNNTDMADDLLSDVGEQQLIPTPVEVAKRVEVVYEVTDE